MRVSRAGMITATTTTVADPLDQAVLDVIGRRPRRVQDVLVGACSAAPVTALMRRCNSHPFRVRRRVVQRVAGFGLVLFSLLLLVGLVRLVNGVVHGYPVGYLALELLVAAVVIVRLHVWSRTGYGKPTIHAERLIAAGRASREATARVAVRGLGAYPDPVIASALVSTMHSPRPSARAAGHGTAGAAGATYLGGGGSSVGYVDTGSSGGSGDSSGGSSCGSGCGGGGCGGGGI